MEKPMSLKTLACCAALLVVISSLSFAQGPAKLRNEQPALPVDEIIRQFAEKEKEFKTARANYVYRQDIRVQSLNANDRVTGEWRQVWDVTFDSAGRRVEKVILAPQSTLTTLILTKEDLQDFREIQPFVLTADDIGKYNVKYLGKEIIDEIDCYVFDVGPKVMEKDQRYFQGQIWVDDRDLQIVKTYGKAVPDIKTKNNENLFPRFETYREQIDGKNWFPTYTRAVDTLKFTGGAQRIRQVIKYENYRRFEADVKLTFGDAVEGDSAAKGPGASNDNKAPALDPRLKQPPTKK
jgi:outer membrane lipoprotein-sorting protein